MPSANRKQTYDQAKHLYQSARFEEALALLDSAGNAQAAPHLLLIRAKCLAKLGRKDEAASLSHALEATLGESSARKLAAKLGVPESPHASPTEDTNARPGRRHHAWVPLLAAAVAVAAIIAAIGVFSTSGTKSSPIVDTALAKQTPAAQAQTEPSGTTGNTTSSGAPRRRLGGQLRLRGPAALEDDLGGDNLGGIGLGKGPSDPLPDPQASMLASLAPDLRSLDVRSILSAPKEVPGGQTASAQIPPAPAPAAPPNPAATANAPVAIVHRPADSILDFQPYLTKQRIANARGDEVTLCNINPNVGAWYVLETKIGGQKNALHLEVPSLGADPRRRPSLSLYRDGLAVTAEGQPPRYFPLWAGDSAAATGAVDTQNLNPAPVLSGALEAEHKFDSPYTVICDGFVLIRSQKRGSATRLENVTDLLRTTSVGDWFVSKAKPYLIASPEMGEDHRGSNSAFPAHDPVSPQDALVDQTESNLYCAKPNLGIESDAPANGLYYGKWYKAVRHPGVFVSIMKAAVIDDGLLATYKDRVGTLGKHDKKNKENEALIYLVACDLSRFRFGFAMGADHPRVDWSPRAPGTKNAGGPDGFGAKDPLSTIGVLPPYYMDSVEAAFAGGFKREHGVFTSGALAKVNSGSHFGFMEQGTVFSYLQPNLATAAITRDGALDLMTWPEDASSLLPNIAHARQNCVPIIEGIDASGASIPGLLVNQWGPGAWSGDQAGDFLSLRAGLAIQETKDHRYAIFAYFTGATPNAMARVFQAYRCKYAMLLDMNTPNYCYFALYTHNPDGSIAGECLNKDMISGNGNDGSLKFIQKNDTRDFFYMLRKE